MIRKRINPRDVCSGAKKKHPGVSGDDLALIHDTCMVLIKKHLIRNKKVKLKYIGVLQYYPTKARGKRKGSIRLYPTWELSDRAWREWDCVPEVKHNRSSNRW